MPQATADFSRTSVPTPKRRANNDRAILEASSCRRLLLSFAPTDQLGSIETVCIMSVPSLTSYVVKRPYLKRWLQPIAEWYTNAAGYRRLGLRYIPSHLAIDTSPVSIVDI